MRKNLLIWGRGGHAKVVYDHARSFFVSIVQLDDNDEIYKTGQWSSRYEPHNWAAFVAIGDNLIREKIISRLDKEGYFLSTIISRHAFISSSARIASGVFIGPMTCIQAEAQLGRGVIINTGATIDHDCSIGDFTHIAPGVHLCGNVTIGNRTLVGVGSSAIPRVYIANSCIIAGGSSIADNLTRDFSLYAGNPAVFKKNLI